MKAEVKKKAELNAVPEAALEEAGLAKETCYTILNLNWTG